MAMFSPFSALTAAAGGFAKSYPEDQAKAYDLMGMQALGNAFKQMQGPIAPLQGIGPAGVPQGIPQGPQGPQAPPPGQSSQPMQPPQSGPPLGPQMAAAAPSMAGGAMPPGGSAQPPGGPPPGGGGMIPGGGQIIGGGPTGAPPSGGMPPQGPPGGGIVDLQTLVQKINQSNPGLPPQALVAALTRAAPLLTLQGKQDLAMLRQQMMAENLNLRRDALDLRRDLGERRADAADTKATETKSEAQQIWEAMKRGDQPPTMTGLYRLAPEVRAAAAKDTSGASLAKMQQEWSRAQKQILSLNGPQMIRYQGLAHSVVNTIDEVKRLSEEMENSGIPLLNRAKMAAYAQTQGNTPNGQLVAKYMAGVNTLKEEFANLAQGGYAPTESAWALANQQINGDYGVKQLGASLEEVQRLIQYRLQGIPGIGTLGTDAPNRYVPGGTGSQQSSDPMDAAKQQLREGMSPAGAPKVDLGGGWSAQRVQ